MTDVLAPEREALAALRDAARAQLAALRDASPEAFEAASAHTLDAVSDLDRRRRARERRVAQPDAPAAAPEHRAALEAAAREARAACDDLDTALGQAVALGHDLIGAWQRLSAPATAQVYTAQGALGAPAGGTLRQTG